MSNWQKWDWGGFHGSALGLEYNRRELANLDEVLRTHVKRRGVVVQAGGNLGIFPKRLAEEFENVYTFEPDVENFLALCFNCWEPNVHRFQAALGAETTTVFVSHDRRDGKPATHEGTYHVIDGPGDVLQFALDDLSFPGEVDLLYLDVEGYEPDVIIGAKRLILDHAPVIVLEMNKQVVARGLTVDSMVKAMAVAGYREAAVLGSDHVLVPEGK